MRDTKPWAVRKLESIIVVLEPPYHVRNAHPDCREQECNEWARQIEAHVHDHRSLDGVLLQVQRGYVSVCVFCGAAWEEGHTCPPE